MVFVTTESSSRSYFSSGYNLFRDGQDDISETKKYASLITELDGEVPSVIDPEKGGQDSPQHMTDSRRAKRMRRAEVGRSRN